jgi:hypothetical protein
MNFKKQLWKYTEWLIALEVDKITSILIFSGLHISLMTDLVTSEMILINGN